VRGVRVSVILIVVGIVMLVLPQLLSSTLPRLILALSNLTTVELNPLSDYRLPLRINETGLLVVAVNYTRTPQVFLSGVGGFEKPEVTFSQDLFSILVFPADAAGDYYVMFHNNNTLPVIIRYSIILLSSSELNSFFIALAISFAGFIVLIGGILLLIVIIVKRLLTRRPHRFS
jgi:hypothetical protein